MMATTSVDAPIASVTTETPTDTDSSHVKSGSVEVVRTQLEKLLSRDNLSKDPSVGDLMCRDSTIPVTSLLAHPTLQILNTNAETILQAAAASDILGSNFELGTVTPQMRAQRTTLMFRDLPDDTTATELQQFILKCQTATNMFGCSGINTGKQIETAKNTRRGSTGGDKISSDEDTSGENSGATGGTSDNTNNTSKALQIDQILEIRPDVGGCWFVTLVSEDLTQQVAMWLHSQEFRGGRVRACVKSTMQLRCGVRTTRPHHLPAPTTPHSHHGIIHPTHAHAQSQPTPGTHTSTPHTTDNSTSPCHHHNPSAWHQISNPHQYHHPTQYQPASTANNANVQTGNTATYTQAPEDYSTTRPSDSASSWPVEATHQQMHHVTQNVDFDATAGTHVDGKLLRRYSQHIPPATNISAPHPSFGSLPQEQPPTNNAWDNVNMPCCAPALCTAPVHRCPSDPSTSPTPVSSGTNTPVNGVAPPAVQNISTQTNDSPGEHSNNDSTSQAAVAVHTNTTCGDMHTTQPIHTHGHWAPQNNPAVMYGGPVQNSSNDVLTGEEVCTMCCPSGYYRGGPRMSQAPNIQQTYYHGGDMAHQPGNLQLGPNGLSPYPQHDGDTSDIPVSADTSAYTGGEHESTVTSTGGHHDSPHAIGIFPPSVHMYDQNTDHTGCQVYHYNHNVPNYDGVSVPSTRGGHYNGMRHEHGGRGGKGGERFRGGVDGGRGARRHRGRGAHYGEHATRGDEGESEQHARRDGYSRGGGGRGGSRGGRGGMKVPGNAHAEDEGPNSRNWRRDTTTTVTNVPHTANRREENRPQRGGRGGRQDGESVNRYNNSSHDDTAGNKQEGRHNRHENVEGGMRQGSRQRGARNSGQRGRGGRQSEGSNSYGKGTRSNNNNNGNGGNGGNYNSGVHRLTSCTQNKGSGTAPTATLGSPAEFPPLSEAVLVRSTSSKSVNQQASSKSTQSGDDNTMQATASSDNIRNNNTRPNRGGRFNGPGADADQNGEQMMRGSGPMMRSNGRLGGNRQQREWTLGDMMRPATNEDKSPSGSTVATTVNGDLSPSDTPPSTHSRPDGAAQNESDAGRMSTGTNKAQKSRKARNKKVVASCIEVETAAQTPKDMSVAGDGNTCASGDTTDEATKVSKKVSEMDKASEAVTVAV